MILISSSHPLIHMQVHLDQKACKNYFKSYNFLSTALTPPYYHPYLVANYLHNTRRATSLGQSFSSEYSFNYFSNDRAMLINEEHLKLLNCERNYRLQYNACSEIRPNAKQASMAKPSSFTNKSQNLQQGGNEVKEDKDNNESEIDLTVHPKC